MLDIAVIIPELSRYGGAQRFVMECVARWQHAHDVTLYSASFNQDLLEEHGISDRVRLKGISPLTEGPHALLYNCTVLPKKWALEIGKHDVYQAHLWPTHLIDLHPMVWYAHEPLRVLYDLCGWDRPIPVHAASDLKTTAERHSPISRAQYCGPGPDSQVLCGSVAGWSGFDDPVRGQVAALPMTYSAPRQSFVPLDVLGRYARVFRGFDEEFRRAEGSVTGWSGLGDPVRGQVAALPTTYSAPRQSFMPLDVLGRYAREIRRVAGNSRFGGRGGRSSGLPAEKYLEFAWEEKWSTDYREFLRMMHAVDRLGQVERCVANSEYTAKYLEDVYGRGCDGVVYPGVTAAEFECGATRLFRQRRRETTIFSPSDNCVLIRGLI